MKPLGYVNVDALDVTCLAQRTIARIKAARAIKKEELTLQLMRERTIRRFWFDIIGRRPTREEADDYMSKPNDMYWRDEFDYHHAWAKLEEELFNEAVILLNAAKEYGGETMLIPVEIFTQLHKL